MSLDIAIRLTEILIGFAFFQQSIEHLRAFKNESVIFIPRLILSGFLMMGFQAPFVCLGLFLTSIAALYRFQGPYNGGSDRMGILIIVCLCVVHFLPTTQWREYIFGYLAVQLTLSYFIAGWVKVMNPEWRTGRALMDVFEFSAYPVSETVRNFIQYPRLILIMSWAVIVFEMLFPLALLSQTMLIIGLCIAALFHLANACLFGLNRFFWVWIAAYPSIIWLQDRIF